MMEILRWVSYFLDKRCEMCVGIPMQIVELYDEMGGVVEAGGVRRHCFFTAIDDPKVGEFVLVHAGTAIGKIDKDDVEENVKLIEKCILG